MQTQIITLDGKIPMQKAILAKRKKLNIFENLYILNSKDSKPNQNIGSIAIILAEVPIESNKMYVKP